LKVEKIKVKVKSTKIPKAATQHKKSRITAENRGFGAPFQEMEPKTLIFTRNCWNLILSDVLEILKKFIFLKYFPTTEIVLRKVKRVYRVVKTGKYIKSQLSLQRPSNGLKKLYSLRL
jgi:hypothetical protein